MSADVWIGMVEVRQLPSANPKIKLQNKGAFTWVASWATDPQSYQAKVSEVMEDYGLFVVEVEHVMPNGEADGAGFGSAELVELVENARQNENFCIFGTFHNYRYDT